MYFDYQGTGSWGWTGGTLRHRGVSRPPGSSPKGTPGRGFEEWLWIQNPGASNAHAQASPTTRKGEAPPS